jgi:hypothetical protein
LDPEIAAGALAAMTEHFCFVTLGQVGGDLAVDEKKAVKTIATLWYRTLYREPCGHDRLRLRDERSVGVHADPEAQRCTGRCGLWCHVRGERKSL